MRKRRTVGARTDRNTWVRIERRLVDKIPGHGWNGAEAAARLEGIAQPTWHGCVVWVDGPANGGPTRPISCLPRPSVLPC